MRDSKSEPRWSYSDLFVALLRQFLRPGKQLFQEVRVCFIHVLRNLRQQVFQIFVDLQVVCLGRLYQAVDGCAGFGIMDGINDMTVGSANGKGSDGPPCCGIINRNIAILQEYFQVLFLVYAVV